ncbi:ATP-binding protein [Desulfopila aestuarii]|uniref:histidine kinase n=1 Tax=Desulfopila aestuarii DSM 18488 TaxID=1121416 RepID=A0A1M7Y7V2_9BACT|nr:ATP-binding protein [Desulfopila aestuarii]SHO48636.1 PAS domain S-box-containing protein [Desulfopila aestuarii DSM 18488]
MKKFPFLRSLRSRLTLAFIGLAVGPIVVVGLVLSFKSIHSLKNEAIAHQQIEAERIGIAVEDYVHELERVLELTSKAHGFLSLMGPEKENILEELIAYENRFEALTLVDSDGKELVHCNRIKVVSHSASVDHANDPAFQQVVKLKTNYFSPVQFNTVTGEPYLTIAIPLQSLQTGDIEYVLFGSARLKKIWDLLATLSHTDQTIFIVDDKGNIVGHPDPSVPLGGKKFQIPANPSGIVSGLNGSEVVMATKRLEFGEQSIYIVAQMEVDKALVLAREIISISSIVVIIALLLAAGLSSLVIGSIIRPLQHLSSVARTIQQGGLDQQVEYSQNDEVGELGQAFNEMTSRLRSTIENLEQEVAERKSEIAERLKVETALSNSRRMLRQILDTIPQSIFWKDINGFYLGCNQVFIEAVGLKYPELIEGKTDFDLPWPKEEAEAYRADDREVTQSNKPKRHIIEPLQQSDGKRLWIDTTKVPLLDENGKVYGILGVYEDITERQRAEEEKQELEKRLQQAQKMEAIGTLAGGIAHDFNNILGAILGYAEMIRENLPSNPEIIGDIDQVIKAGNRAKELVKQILAFSRQSETEKIPIQPAIIIKEAIKLLRPSLPTTITIKQDIAPDVGTILADPNQLHQVLMNLCTNAFHAMEIHGGTLSISLHTKVLTPEELGDNPKIQPGNFMQLSVRDSGTGIPPEIRKRIFDPYFTSKEIGKGTGMGLAMVHGIVQSCGGFITFESQLGEGTVFHVFLPLAETLASPEIEALENIPSGKEHILLIDDEDLLLEMGKTMLERLGYKVTIRTNGIAGLTTFQNQPDMYDLVITDQTMPGMTGIDMSRRMLQIRPDIPIVLCTGYSSVISEEKINAMGIKGFAMKPLAKRDIAVLIRKVLER